MKRALVILSLILAALIILSCGKKQTPEHVLKSYEKLKSELGQDAIGESIKKLEDFGKMNRSYKIADVVSEEIKKLREKIDGRFHFAKELARSGEFEQAEKILKDLAQYFPDTEDGKLAKKDLQFDFYMFKAQTLTMKRQLDEAEQIIKELLEKDISSDQKEIAERLLDSISISKQATEQSRLANMKSFCANLRILLEMYYNENGSYPAHLSLDSLKLGDQSTTERAREYLSAIESYTTSNNHFSFIAVSKDGKTRLRVTQDGIKGETGETK